MTVRSALARVGIVFAFVAFGAAPGHAESFMMGALGDSISAASLANTSAVHGAAAEDQLNATLTIAPTLPELEAATDAPDADRGIMQNKDTLSWVSGLNEEIQSHGARLGTTITRSGTDALDIDNEATPGNTSADLTKQVDKLVAHAAENGATIKYVTLMIGANDACSKAGPTGTPDQEMADNLAAAFAKLAAVAQNEPIRVLVSGMPDIPALGRPEIAEHTTFLGLKCSFVRDKILKWCNPMTKWTTPEELAERESIVQAKNAVLESAATEAAKQYPNLDIVFTNRLYQQTLTIDELAADCFHPNPKGHRMLADLLWQDQPWFH